MAALSMFRVPYIGFTQPSPTPRDTGMLLPRLAILIVPTETEKGLIVRIPFKPKNATNVILRSGSPIWVGHEASSIMRDGQGWTVLLRISPISSS